MGLCLLMLMNAGTTSINNEKFVQPSTKSEAVVEDVQNGI